MPNHLLTPAHRPTGDQRLLAIGLEFLWAAYLAIGLFGAAWIDFDFNEIYIQLVAYAVIPTVAVYYGMKILLPTWQQKYPRTYLGVLVGLFLTLLPAQALLVNAATSEGVVKRDISRDSGLLTVAAERGGLGIVYRKRW